MIRVRDLDASLQFYTNLLGMKLLRKRDYPGGKFTLAFVGYGDESNNTMIELTHNWGQAGPYDLGSTFGHLAAVFRRLQDLRAPGLGGRKDPAAGWSHGARRVGHRLYRRSGRLSDRADPAPVVLASFRPPRLLPAGREGQVSGPPLNRHIMARGGTREELARTADLGVWVLDHLSPLGDPADGTRNREEHREHRGRKPHRSQNDP